MAVTSPQSRGSACITRGFRVDVTPEFRPDQSRPDQGRWVFGYRIRVTNTGAETAQLLSRHWIIVDADGERHEVAGDGVVGQQPHLPPGAHFEYESYCPLQTPWGTMEGEFTMQPETPEGAKPAEPFLIRVERFYLVSGEER